MSETTSLRRKLDRCREKLRQQRYGWGPSFVGSRVVRVKKEAPAEEPPPPNGNSAPTNGATNGGTGNGGSTGNTGGETGNPHGLQNTKRGSMRREDAPGPVARSLQRDMGRVMSLAKDLGQLRKADQPKAFDVGVKLLYALADLFRSSGAPDASIGSIETAATKLSRLSRKPPPKERARVMGEEAVSAVSGVGVLGEHAPLYTELDRIMTDWPYANPQGPVYEIWALKLQNYLDLTTPNLSSQDWGAPIAEVDAVLCKKREAAAVVRGDFRAAEYWRQTRRGKQGNSPTATSKQQARPVPRPKQTTSKTVLPHQGKDPYR